jgi:hypothetical protein
MITPSKRNKTKIKNIPKVVPTPPTDKTLPSASKHRIPMTIRINASTKQHATLNKTCILIALRHAFQSVDQGANIIQPSSPKMTATHDTKTIFSAEDITSSSNNIAKYLEHSQNAPIILNINLELFEYKRDQQFFQWLKDEHFNLDHNILQQTLQPVQVGVFTHMNPRTDLTTNYEHCIQMATTTTCPPFSLQVKHIKTTSVTTKVWSVYADMKNINDITKELKAAFNSQELRRFYSWHEFTSLNAQQQTTVLQANNKFSTEYRSLLISGFKNNISCDTLIWDNDFPHQADKQ